MTDKRPGDLSLYFRLLSYVKPYWKVFAISIVAMILLAITNPATAAIFKYIVDGVFLSQDSSRVEQIILALVLLSVVAALANYVSSLSLHWVSNRVVMDLRSELFARLLYMPSNFYDAQSSGVLVSKFTFDVTQIKEASTNVLNVFVRDSLTIVGLFAWMVYIDWELSLIALFTAPVIAGFLLVIRRRLRRMSGRIQESMGDINHILNEIISAERIIKIFGAQAKEQDRFDNSINQNRKFTMKFASAATASSPLVQLITVFALAVIIYVSSEKAAQGSMGVDDFVSFFTAILMILGPLKRLARINEHIQRGLAACESVFNLLDEETEYYKDVESPLRLDGDIEFKDLSFSYPGTSNEVLKEVSFTVRAKENVALVGVSGSGKSTIASLLPQFYSVAGKSIYINGRDVGEIPLAELRHSISLVSQETILFNESIRYNISYGAKTADETAIQEAAEKAHALEFISAFEEGFDTVIGDRGSNLSGGQRQRIALARAFLKDAPILILDEATSALDSESERLIQQALEEIGKDRTCLIIAHRLSTIENASRVVVIDKGRVIEQGTHEELLRARGSYAALYTSTSETGMSPDKEI